MKTEVAFNFGVLQTQNGELQRTHEKKGRIAENPSYMPTAKALELRL
jgi:hypothetical protein